MTQNVVAPIVAALLDRVEAATYKARFAVQAGVRRRAERDIERAAAGAFRAVAGRIDERRLRSALRRGDIDAAMAEVPFDEIMAVRLRSDVGGAIRDALTASGARATQLLRQKLVRKDVDYRVKVENLRFDVLNERVLEAMREHGADLVTELVGTSKTALRELLVQMATEGVSVTSQVTRIQQVVGMHSRHIQAVTNLENRLRSLGWSEKRIARRIASKARELHRLRATFIGRYESGWAIGQGQQQAWLQARDEGVITDQAKRVWRTANDDAVRDEHAAMEGVTVGLEDQFGVELPNGSTQTVLFPPTDPGCRCSIDIEP